MRIAVLGAGKMGSALARVWAQAGHQVVIGCRREFTLMSPLISELGSSIQAMAIPDAASWSEAVALALPWDSRTELAASADSLAGKVVLDAMNAYSSYPSVVDLGTTTSSEAIALDIPHTRLVKALNTLQARDVLACGREAGSAQRIAVPICGNDTGAKRVVAALVDDIGFDVVDIGILPNGRWSEPTGPLFGKNCSASKLMDLARECGVPGLWEDGSQLGCTMGKFCKEIRVPSGISRDEKNACDIVPFHTAEPWRSSISAKDPHA